MIKKTLTLLFITSFTLVFSQESYYNSVNLNLSGVGNTASTLDDMIDLFLNWNAQDPVSDFEKQRNIFHENTNNNYAQGNRNPLFRGNKQTKFKIIIL